MPYKNKEDYNKNKREYMRKRRAKEKETKVVGLSDDVILVAFVNEYRKDKPGMTMEKAIDEIINALESAKRGKIKLPDISDIADLIYRHCDLQFLSLSGGGHPCSI